MTHNENGANNRCESVGLILAAGYSSRMGGFKPLLPIGDMTAIERVIDTLKKAGVQNIIGVTGYQRERMSHILKAQGVTEAFNPDFDQGMFTSVKAGIANALVAQRAPDSTGRQAPDGAAEGAAERPGKPDGFFLMLVDCPLVPPEVLGLILDKHREYPDAFILPCYRGKNGHPLYIPAQYADEILAYEGEGGLKAVRDRHVDRLIRLETDMEAVVLDMDTPEGYEEILEYHSLIGEAVNRSPGFETQPDFALPEFEKQPDYEAQLQGRRLFLIRHGEIRQHREKIFLGQTDAPLSKKGREQAAQAAEELMRYGITAGRIYTSDLSRASETAEIIRDGLERPLRAQETPDKPAAAISVIREPRLREMSLGEWDGRFISEIMEQYPEEYRKRGENLLAYKFGNEGENFYDLHYRVMKGFRSVLRREKESEGDAKDILIVAHQGVINVILSSLRHTELGEEIKRNMSNGGVIVMDYTNEKKEIQA